LIEVLESILMCPLGSLKPNLLWVHLADYVGLNYPASLVTSSLGFAGEERIWGRTEVTCPYHTVQP
jgi:hypothetical protein